MSSAEPVRSKGEQWENGYRKGLTVGENLSHGYAGATGGAQSVDDEVQVQYGVAATGPPTMMLPTLNVVARLPFDLCLHAVAALVEVVDVLAATAEPLRQGILRNNRRAGLGLLF